MSEKSATAERTEMLEPGPAEALAGLLEVDLPDVHDTGLPLLWHWVYLLDRPRQSDLGADGHPVRNVVVAPPGPGRRRMWAGGRVQHRGALRVGEPATRTSRIVSSTDKVGRSGHLTFVVLRHTISQRGQDVIVEDHDIVYRDAVTDPAPDPVLPERVEVAGNEWEIPTDPTLLFRFSALTYNGHRIHYDRAYARDVERYPGLVTHGPLQALAMAEVARREGAQGPLSIEYRMSSPLFDHEGLVASAVPDGHGWTTAVRDVGGRVTARGTVARLA